jgi:hypothetical protein
MRVSDSANGARRRRVTDLAGLALAGVLVIALAACGSQRASTRSGVVAPVSSSDSSLCSESASFVSPTRYVGVAMMPNMTAVMEWIRTGSTAVGTIDLSGDPETVTDIGPGRYPLCISFVDDPFHGNLNLQVNGRLVPVSGQLTATGVLLTFDGSPAMNPSLTFTSIGPGRYSYPPSDSAG